LIPLEKKTTKPIDFDTIGKLAAQLFGFPQQPTANGEQATENFER